MNIKEMINIYYPYSNLDWLNYQINGEITYHHIIKKCDGGKRIISNGALLIPTAHQYLHLIEHLDPATYDLLNDYFRIINRQKEEPKQYQREDIEQMLLDFEKIHRWEKGKDDKLLIKKKYLKRW